MTNPSNELIDSYYRCRHDEDFIDTFYKVFLSKAPAIARMFAKTDFKLQKLMLRQSLLEVICFDRGMSGTCEEIKRLGRRHHELGVTPDMYTMWLDALCESIRKHDPHYTLELENLWRKAMRKSIDVMISMSASQQSGGC